MKPGSTYVDMSTSTPWLARDIHAAFKQAGLDALDAPLSNGGVFIGVGGDEAAYERCRPVLEAAGEHVFRVGGPGMGQAAKLVRQYVAFSSFMAEAEGLVIAAKAGLDPGKMATFLGQTLGSSPHRERVIGALLQGDFGDPETAASKLDIVAKDLALAVELARRAGSPANVGLAASDVLQRGQAQGWGRLNFWSAVQVIEEMAGAQVRDTYNRSDAI
jgi:3-hydroxyisobutyrate dehydrogenase-like beta-hydroxyacid dehydrogenase